MKIVVVSDNHGQELTLKRIFDHYAGSDVTLCIREIQNPFIKMNAYRIVFVAGNCDYDPEYPRSGIYARRHTSVAQ